MTGTSSHLNAELANFFRCHTKNIKLTKEESEYIDNLLFSQSSPTKKTLPLFPRATPYGKETLFTSSKYPSLTSTGLKSSRKRLEIFDKDLESFKPSFSLSEEVPVTVSDNTMNIATLETVKNDPVNNFHDHKVNESEIIRSPPRQMTDAAKELMASISMNVDDYPEPKEIPSNIPKQTENLPSFEFKIPETSLPVFHFDISQEATRMPAEKRPEFEFPFDISGYSRSASASMHVPDNELPKFHFKIE